MGVNGKWKRGMETRVIFIAQRLSPFYIPMFDGRQGKSFICSKPTFRAENIFMGFRCVLRYE